MNSTVVLQPDLNAIYTSALVYAAALVLLVLLRMLFVKLRGRKKTGDDISKAVSMPQMTESRNADPKKVYLKKLTALEKEWEQNKITSRACYQSLSGLLRSFVTEVTGTDVMTKTLIEIRMMGLPGLQTLIEEYYEAEFGPDTEQKNADPRDAIEKTKKVIKAWN